MNRPSPTLLRTALLAWLLAMTVGSHWPRLDLGGSVGVENSILPFGLDKWAHFIAFAGLGFLLLAADLLPGRLVKRLALAAVALAAWAAIDEITQHFSPGRTVQFSDWVASTGGAFTGLAAWVAARWFARSHDGSFISHTRVVSAMTVLSRVFGLVRDWALARVFGFGTVMDAFIIAFMVPNLFRRLFGEGALAAAFIPHYSRLRERESSSAIRLALLVVDALTASLVIISTLGAAALLALAWLGPLETRGSLTAALTAVTLWYMPLVCVAAILGAVLQVHGRFAVPAATPIILNLFVIAAAFVAAFSFSDSLAPEHAAFIVAGAIVIAGIVQVAWQVIALRREGVRIRNGRGVAAWKGDPLVRDATGGLLRQWGPTVLGLAIFQLNALADALIAMIFSGPSDRQMNLLNLGYLVDYPMAEGSVGVLGMAQRLYEFPLGVFGIAVATAIFPALSAAAQNTERFATLLRQGLRLTVFIALPASVGLLLVRYPLAGTIFHEGGQLEPGDSARVAYVLTGYAVAVWAFSMNQILVRAFYAQHDAKTPMRVGLALVGLNIALNLTLIWPLGAAGLAWSTSLCATLQTATLLTLLRRYVPAPVDRSVFAGWARTAAVTLVMAAAVWLAIGRIELENQPWSTVVGTLMLGTAVGAAVVALGALALKMAELRWLLGNGVQLDPPR